MHPDPHGLMSRTSLLDMGYTDTDLQRFCARGELDRLASEFYVKRELMSSLDARGKHRLATIATLRVNSADAVASHVSAAVLQGLDMWDADLERVHLTIPGGHGRTNAGLHMHSTSLPGHFVTSADEVPLTTLDRTVSALSESPGESLSRVRMKEFGIPEPVLQQVLTVKGRFLARVDFYWKRWRIVGDGRLGPGKYDDRGVVTKEKVREDEIRDRGMEVIRWEWKDLWYFGRVRDKFDRARRRAEMRS